MEYITKIFLQSDSAFSSVKNEYGLISKFLSLFINSVLIYKANSNFGEYVLNFVKLDTNTSSLISETNKKYLFITIEYIIPIIYSLISRLRFGFIPKLIKYVKLLKLVKTIIDVLYKFKFIFKPEFIYSDLIEHLLKIMIVNQGTKDTMSDKFLNIGKQLNLFFLYMFIRFGEWYYTKEVKNETVIEIDPPKINNRAVLNKCPICNDGIISPIVVKCCGFVYCDICLREYLKSKEKCLICKNSIDIAKLIKIYK